MARHKLRLSKLEFVSLVDQPAQEPANVRLIKRKGSTDQVEVTATARLAKIDAGDNPLAYFWAFTCTDETGAPYHDLQGDAIEPDAYVKAAEEFMASGGAVDEMHDGKRTSRVAFAFPMDSDIAEGMFGAAIGKQVKTSGLMVAIRPSREALAKLRSGAYTGVSIAGLGTRELAKRRDAKPGKKPARYGKTATPTSETDGHAHTIDLCSPASCWGGSLQTSYQTTAGAEQSHSHAWTYDPATGAITILPDSGHTHTTDGVVSAETMAEALEEDDECEARCDEPAVGAPVVVQVNARAPAPISTPAPEVPTVKATTQESPPMDTKTAKMIATALALPEAQREHAAKLDPVDQETFLGFDSAARDVAVKTAADADPEVYKTAGGLSIRKSHGPVAEMLAKQADASAAQLAAQGAELAVSKAAAELAAIQKRATDLIPLIGKSLAERAAIVKSVDSIPDEATRVGAIEALRGANAAFRTLGVAIGTDDGGAAPESNKPPLAAWESGLADFAKSKNIANDLDAIVPFLKTEQGKTLKKALDAQRPAAQPS